MAPNSVAACSWLSDAIRWLLALFARNKDAISSIESLSKIAALIIGAIWAWKGFLRTRLSFPCAKVEHVITSWKDQNKIFLRVTVRISNVGSVLLQIASGKTWIEKLTPLPKRIRDSIAAGSDVIPSNKHEIDWSLLAKHELTEKDGIEVEPNESDELHFDFVMENEISRVLVYTRLENSTKSGSKKIGWNLSSIYVMDSGETYATTI